MRQKLNDTEPLDEGACGEKRDGDRLRRCGVSDKLGLDPLEHSYAGMR
jgi:hypothetical protein